MNRTEEERPQSYRTVTEIFDADDLYQKDFDVSDLQNKNEAYIRDKEKKEMNVIVAQYIAMVKELRLPDIKIVFGSNNTVTDMINLVYNSLAFINQQVFPHSTQFVDMKFAVVPDRQHSLATEPIAFYKPIDSASDQVVTCYVDRANVLRILDKTIDVNLKFENGESKNELLSTLLDSIKMMEKRSADRFFNNDDDNTKMDETYVTQFVTLLIIFSNAYLAYYKLVRNDFNQYFDFITNNDIVLTDTSMPNITNLFTTYFTFSVDAIYDKKTKSTLNFKRN